MSVNQKTYYISRINIAIDYIEKNIAEPLSLEKISKAAGISPFHFHRLFKSFMGENLNQFVRRVRIEKAANMLYTNPNYPMTEIALANGFSSSQSFAREFRNFFDTTPRFYRQSKIRHKNSNNRKDYLIDFHYDENNRRPSISFTSTNQPNMKVEIKTLPDMTLAYLRHIGPYKGNPALFEKLFNQLCSWAGPRNLINQESKFICIYHDGPEVTDESKLRMDICVSVPADTQVDGEIGKQDIAGGEYAVARCVIKDPKEYEQYWNEVYNNWLPGSGYQPDNKPPFEMYPGDCKQENGDMLVDICIPVKIIQ